MSQMQQSSVGQCWAGSGLTVTVTESDATRADLQIAGELDLASAALLAACLEHQLDTGRRFLHADLSGLAFIDSSGIAVIAEAHRAFMARRGTLVLTGLSVRTRSLLHVTGLDSVLLIAPDSARVAEVATPEA